MVSASQLLTEASKQTRLAHQKAAARAGHEPAFVAHLCSRMPELAKQWNAVLKSAGCSFTLDLTSVFIHGVPHAQFGASTCELADLLVAIVDHRHKPAKGRATLIQAKMNSGRLLSLNSTEAVQLRLLETRPVFSLVKPKVLGVTFDISAAARSATLYGGAFECTCSDPKCLQFPSPGMEAWTAGEALTVPSKTRQVLLDQTMAKALVDLLLGWAGQPFNYDPLVTDKSGSWSHLINHLIQNARNSTYMAATASGASRSRVRQGSMHLQIATGASIRHLFQYGEPQYMRQHSHEQPRSFVESDPGGDGGDDDFNLQIGEGEPEGGAPSVIVFEINGNGRDGTDSDDVDS
jgi:hypothetical protein